MSEFNLQNELLQQTNMYIYSLHIKRWLGHECAMLLGVLISEYEYLKSIDGLNDNDSFNVDKDLLKLRSELSDEKIVTANNLLKRTELIRVISIYNKNEYNYMLNLERIKEVLK